MQRIRLIRSCSLLAALALASMPSAFSQQPAVGPQPAQRDASNTTAPAPASKPEPRRMPDYVLGPQDQIVLFGADMKEIDGREFRISSGGDISVPTVGRIHAAGMTVAQLEEELVKRFKEYYIDPQIAVNLTELKSQPVSVVGAVGNPGVVQLEGRRRLFEVLTMAGGPAQNAGWRMTIQRVAERGPIPLPSNRLHETGKFFIAEVNLLDILHARRPEYNIEIVPEDVLTVPVGEIVYVSGAVRKPGGFVLAEQNTMPVLMAVARAEGALPTAKKKDAKIFRQVGAEFVSIPVNLADVEKGKVKDIALLPNDILHIDDSSVKNAFRRTIDSVISYAAGAAIYGIYY